MKKIILAVVLVALLLSSCDDGERKTYEITLSNGQQITVEHNSCVTEELDGNIFVNCFFPRASYSAIAVTEK